MAGYVQTAGIFYFYKFTGQKGDIASVICDSQGLNSPLDSIIFITTDDGRTIIGENDQNGLYNTNDSFLQVVLPADGAFYLVLADYNGSAGLSYSYRMHFKLISAS